jgi:DNA invertase Pin-like site-specific DNA recombinase
VSTIDQNPQLQLDALAAAGCKRVFKDVSSGARESRPQLDRALDHLRPGDTLVVWKLDRLGRTMRQLIDLSRHLEEREIAFRSLTEAIDTSSAGGRVYFHIMGALAEFERDRLVERTKAGLAAARARGRNGGRPSLVTADKLAAAKGSRQV